MRLTEEILDAMSREELITALNSASNCINSIEELSKRHNGAQGTFEKEKEKSESIRASKNPVTLGIIGCVAALLILLGITGISNSKHIFLCLVMIVVGLFMALALYVRVKTPQSEYDAQADKYYQEKAIPAQQRMQEAEEQTRQVIKSEEYENARFLVPEEYFDTESIAAMVRLLSNRRAKTLADAMNLYETQLHEQRMEQAANRTAEAQESAAEAAWDTAKSARKTAKNTKSTARAAKVNAFINYLNYKK